MNLNRTRTLIAIGALGMASITLLGCASSESAAQTAEQRTAPSGAGERGPMGVSGTIAAAEDGLLQVQDSQSQTAVSYDDDTVVTQELEASIADVSEGVCVTVIGAGDDSTGAATTVSIAQPVDGECSPASGRGMPGGEEGFAPPADGEMPEDLPERPDDLPEGEMPEGMPEGGPGGIASGIVTAVNGSTITIDAATRDAGSQEVAVDAATVFTKTAEATSDALVVGACIAAVGEYEGEQYAATSLAVSEAGDDGCTAGFGGGLPGRGGNS